jgi:hypothetical protein
MMHLLIACLIFCIRTVFPCLQRRTHFDSADYYMQREGKASPDVLAPNNLSPQPASPLLERPALLCIGRPSRLSCSR